MNFNIIKYLDLIWRIIGGNILVLIVGILAKDSYLISVNLTIIFCMILNLLSSKITMESDMGPVVTRYIIIRMLVNVTMIDSELQSILSLVNIAIEGAWIIKFYLVAKSKA